MSDDARSSPNWPEPTEEVELLRKQLREETARADNLMLALESSRVIGTAMGVVMERRRVTSADAFEVLRRVSMNRNRKLREVARDVVDTGVIPDADSRSHAAARGGPEGPSCAESTTALPDEVTDSEGPFDPEWRPTGG
jgi:hypothetical protein